MANQSHDFIKPFHHVPTDKLNRSVFELGYYTQGSASQGELIPVYSELCIPGDKFKIGCQAVVRALALQSPAMTNIKMRTHFFFIPLRLLWDETKDDRWSTFINGGVDGTMTPTLPLWSMSGADVTDIGVGSLWDRFGFPVYDSTSGIGINLTTLPEDSTLWPTDFLRRAYNFVYNEYYRNQNVQEEIELDNNKVLRKMWRKDYFTSCLPWQQRGISPLVPIVGIGGVSSPDSHYTDSYGIKFSSRGKRGVNLNALHVGYDMLYDDLNWQPGINSTEQVPAGDFARNTYLGSWFNGTPRDLWLNQNYWGGITNLFGNIPDSVIENFYVDFTDQDGGIDIADIREVASIQRWLELNARGGSRYTEYLKTHFNTSPSDARLDRPEYIGGASTPIMISEVLQTSSQSSSTPLGDMGGHGISAVDSYVGEYHAEEWGVIIGLMSIEPEAVYSQGINRKWTQRSNLDFYDPLFANLSEQQVLTQELYASNDDTQNQSIFGYQGMWDEYRSNHNQVTGDLRTSLSFWTQQRYFNSAPALNEAFITCEPEQTIFAQTSSTERVFVYTIQHMVKAVRPLPAVADPGITKI